MSEALAQDQINFWWVTVGITAVVIACVVVLLTLLASLVKDIARHITKVEVEVLGGADNTASSPLLETAAGLISGMGQELALHAEVLKSGSIR